MCLMSLDKAEAVPIDTHIWQIAKRDYNYASGNAQKSITDKIHRDIGWYLCTSSVLLMNLYHVMLIVNTA